MDPSRSIAYAVLLTSILGAARGADRVFERDVAPILLRRCTSCHGPEEMKGSLDMTSLEKLLEGGKTGPVVTAGKSAESLIVARITRTDAKVMPPPKAGKPLSAEEIAAVREWIDGGARGGGVTPPPAISEKGREAPAKAPGGPPSGEDRPGPAAAVAFSPDGAYLAIGGDRRVTVVSAATGREAARLDGPSDLVRALAWSPDGSKLAAAGGLPGREGEVLLWSVPRDGATGEEAAWKPAGAIRGHADCIYAVLFSRDGSTIATSSYDRLIKLWATASASASPGKTEEKASLKDHLDGVFAIALSSDGKRLFSASGDRTVKVWEVPEGKRAITLSDATQGLNTLALAPAGGQVAAAGQDRMIRVWKVEEGSATLVRSFFAHEGAVLRVAFSPDGKSLFSAAEDGLLKAWDTEGFTERLVFEKQPDWVLDLAVRGALSQGRPLRGPAAGEFAPSGGEQGGELPRKGVIPPPQGASQGVNYGEAVAVGRHDGSWAVYDARSGRKLLASTGKEPALAAADEDQGEGAEPGPEGGKKRKRDLLVEVVDAGNVTVPPSLGGFSPRAARRGEKVKLSIQGKNLREAEIVFLEPGFKAGILKNDALPRPEFRRTPGSTGAEIVDLSVPHRLEAEIEIAPDTRPGMHRFFALTPAGVTNAQAIYIEELAEGSEAEPNDSPAQAQPLPAEALSGKMAVLGTMDKRGDSDVFRIEAREGQELVFHILSQSIGSGLNGLLEVLGPDGVELASSARREFGNRAEARVAHRFEKAGAHYLRITDKSFGVGGYYRLYAGEMPFVTSFFPPGLQKGTSAEVAVKGFNLGKEMRVKVEAPAVLGWGQTIPLPIPGAFQGGNIAVGDAPEAMEKESNDEAAAAQRVDAPVTINGSLEREGDADFFVFRARKGQNLIIDVVASRIGSLLDSVIEIVDAGGRPLERATLRCVAQTFITLGDRDARTPGLRLDSWADLRVNDHVMVGSEVLKVRLLPDYGDEDVTFFSQSGARSGILDTTPEFHAVNEPAYKVEIHPPGADFPPNGMPVFRLPYRNDDGGMPVHGRDSKLHFTPPSDGDYIVRIRDVQDRGGPDFYYRLQVREPSPDFQFSVSAENINIPRGMRVPFTVSVNRLDDMNGPIEVELVDPLPEGFTLDVASILPDEDEATLTVKAGPEAMSTPLDRVFRLRARASAGGKELVREAGLRALRVAGDPDMVLVMEPAEVRLQAGGTATVTVRASRRNGFKGRIPLEVPNLPHGVVVMNTGLNGILIPENEEVRVYRIQAEAWVPALRRKIYTIGRTETTSPLPTQFSSEPSTLVIEDAEAVAARSF